MKPLTLHPAAEAIGFLVMAVLGWNLAGPAAHAKPQPGESITRHSPRPRPAKRAGPPEHVLQMMNAMRAAALPEDRMRAALALANTLPVSEFAAWLDGGWFNLPDGCEAVIFRKLLNDRWQHEDPEGFALHGLKSGSHDVTFLLGSWPESDPQRVIGFFKEHPVPWLEMQALGKIAAQDPALVLGRLQELIAVGASTNNVGLVFPALAKTSPAALEAMLDSMPSAWRNFAESALVGQRLKDSFPEEIRRLWDRPDGWRLFQKGLSMGERSSADQLLSELANIPASWRGKIAENTYQFLNESNAGKWWSADLEGQGFSAAQASQIRHAAVQQLSYQQPEAALKLLVQTELPDKERRNLIDLIFSQADTPEEAAPLLALLGSEDDRQKAREAMAPRPVACGGGEPRIESPAEWLEQAAALKQNGGDGFVSLLSHWDENKIAEVSQGFRALPDDQKRQVAIMLAGNVAPYNCPNPALTGEAIRYLAAQPDAGNPSENAALNSSQLASTLAVVWAQNDPAAASAWVETLPAGETKSWARKNLAANWANYDSDATEQLINTLPADARAEVNDYLKKRASGGH